VNSQPQPVHLVLDASLTGSGVMASGPFPWMGLQRGLAMQNALFLKLTSFLMIAGSSALAQTPAPGAAQGGGLADYWWMILVLLVIAVAIWYFIKGRRPNV
jgi:hypothetical protein